MMHSRGKILRLVLISVVWLSLTAALCAFIFRQLAPKGFEEWYQLRDGVARGVVNVLENRMKLLEALANMMGIHDNFTRAEWQQTCGAQLRIVESDPQNASVPMRLAYCAAVPNAERAKFEKFAVAHYSPLLSPNIKLITSNRSFVNMPEDYYYPEWLLPILDIYPQTEPVTLGDYTSEPVRRRAALEALQRGVSTITTRTIIGRRGQTGVLGMSPVKITKLSRRCTISDDDPDGWSATPFPATNVCGLMVIFLDLHEVLLTVLSAYSVSRPVAVGLYDKLDEGSQLGYVGNEGGEWAVMQSPPDAAILPQGGILASVHILSRRWALLIYPLPEAACKTNCSLSIIGLTAGTALCGVVGLVFVLWSWHKRYAVEERFKHLGESLRQRDQLLVFMCHELRNMLQSVTCVKDVLYAKAKRVRAEHLKLVSEESRKIVAEANHSLRLLGDVGAATWMAATLLNDTLDLSRRDSTELSSQIVLATEPFELIPWIRTLAAVMDTMARSGVAFTFSVDPEVPGRIIADKTRLTQVVTNVLLTAFKLTTEGSVTMAVRAVCIHDSDWLLVIDVVDTGKVLFDSKTGASPYFTERMSTCYGLGGTNLGLLLCKTLCEKMGGALDITTEGKGSQTTIQVQVVAVRLQQDMPRRSLAASFSIEGQSFSELAPTMRRVDGTIPSIESERNSKAGSREAAPPFTETTDAPTVVSPPLPPVIIRPREASRALEGNPTRDVALISRALIVDDMPLNRRLLSTVLSAFCSVVDQASDGHEALEMVVKALPDNPYELVMTDQDMPVMSGLVSVRRMQDKGSLAAFVLVAGDATEVRKLILTGEDLHVMEKPIRAEDILSCVMPLVRRARRRLRHHRAQLEKEQLRQPKLPPPAATRLQFMQPSDPSFDPYPLPPELAGLSCTTCFNVSSAAEEPSLNGSSCDADHFYRCSGMAESLQLCSPPAQSRSFATPYSSPLMSNKPHKRTLQQPKGDGEEDGLLDPLH